MADDLAAANAGGGGPPPPSPPSLPPPTPRRRRRWWLWLLAPLLLLVALLAALVAGALYHPAVLPWGLEYVPGLKAKGVQGTLAGGDLRIESLEYTLPDDGGRLQIDGLKAQRSGFAFRPFAGTEGSLHLTELSIASLHWHSGKPSGKPPTLPATLRLPLALKIDKLMIGRLQVDDLPPVTDLRASAEVGAKSGALHRIEDLSLQFEQARLKGELQIEADAPLKLTAKLDADQTQAPAWAAKLALDGPLAKLAADLKLAGAAPASGAAPALSAHATLAPFAGWPLESLRLATEQLDLSALSAALPKTALSGTADVHTAGMDQPARVEAALRNALPGAWDTGRVPLRELSVVASGEPRQTDRLTLDNFDLQLGDAAGSAGRVRGKGRWLAGDLALDLQLDGLLPARLDRRAASVELGGPVVLKATGLLPAAPGAAAAPQVDFDATLKGRILDGTGQPVALQLSGEASASQVLIRRAEASSGKARALADIDARADATGWQVRGNLALNRFDPRPWWPGPAGSAWRRGPHRLDGKLAADIHLRTAAPAAAGGDALAQALQAVTGTASLNLADSLLSGMPVDAALKLDSGKTQLDADGQATIAGNRVQIKGRYDNRSGKAAGATDQLQLGLQIPALGALAPLARLLGDVAPGLVDHWPRTGAVNADAQVDGRWPALRSNGALTVQKLASADATIEQAAIDWRFGSAADDPLALKVDGRGIAAAGQTIDAINAQVDGSLREHRLTLQAQSPLRPPAVAENLLGPLGNGTQADLRARGRWLADAAGGGRWQVQDLQLQSGARAAAARPRAAAAGASAASAPAVPAGGYPAWLKARTPAIELRLSPQLAPLSLRADPGRLELPIAAISWRELLWQAGAAGTAGRLALQGELEAIDVAKLLARLQPTTGWGGNLTIGGRIDIRAAERLDAEIVLERGGGDLTLTDDLGDTQPLGLSELRLALTAHDGVWQFAQGLAGSLIGQVGGAQVLRTGPGERFPGPKTPLSGVLEARVANIGVWSAWVPPGWRLVGNLRTSASVGGTLGAPEFSGEMRGAGIGVRNLLQGINLSDGELAITLAGDRAQIERFVFKGGDGTLRVTGDAVLGAAPLARLQLTADHFRLLGRLDRRLVTSGMADIQLGAASLKVDGDLRIDEGLFDISRGDAPTLDDDVVVRRGGAVAATGPADRPAAPPPTGPLRQADVTLRIDLGQNLRLRGHGIDTALRGTLLAGSSAGKMTMRGTIRTVDGKFAAYGQKLDISQGEIDFIGPLDNPRINVRAVRTDVDVVVGVLVTGSATAPRIRLFSEPELPEFDKLSWLVLGRSPSSLGSGDTALLQRAAMALLAGDKPGPTDKVIGALGLTDFSVRQTAGETRDTVVSVGKQLSQRWYLGYERSINTTAGTWQLIYKVAQRFTLRAQSGTDTALDVIWTWRW